MGFRRSFAGWVGGLTVIFGMSFMIIGILMVTAVGNKAVGVPLWSGAILIMCGLAVVVEVMGRTKKKRVQSFFTFPIVPIVANLFTFVISSVVIALLTWSIYDSHLNPTTLAVTPEVRYVFVSYYATIVFMSALLLIFSLSSMFIDCCGSFLLVATPDHEPRPGYYDYGHRQPAGPAVIYK